MNGEPHTKPSAGAVPEESDIEKFARLAQERHRRGGGASRVARVLALSLASVLLLGAAAFAGYRFAAGRIRPASGQEQAQDAQERQNTLLLARRYLDEGLYDDALSLLNSLMIKDADDGDAQELAAEAAALKKQSSALPAGAQGGGDVAAMQSTIESLRQSTGAMQDELLRREEESRLAAAGLQEALSRREEESRRVQEELALQLAENKKNVQVMNELVRAQREAEEERRALQEAEARQRAQEEERRRAEEARKAAESAAAAQLVKDINARIEKGKAALAAGDVQSAIACFDAAKSMLPSDDAKFAAGKLQEISTALYEASRDGSSGEGALLVESATYAGQALAMDGTAPAARYVLAMDALARKDYAAAETLLQQALAADPTNSVYYYQLGRAQAQQKKYEAAYSAFTSSAACNAAYAPAQYNLGYVCERLGKSAQALEAYRTARRIDPAYERAYLAAGRLLLRGGDYSGAAAEFAGAVKVNPSSAQNHQELGAAYAASGDYAAAEQSFRKALAYMDPAQKDPLTYYNLSTVLYAESKTEAALSAARQAYECRSGASASLMPGIVYNYALLCEKTGDTDSAVALYREVLSYDPSNVKALTNLGALCLAQSDADTAVAFLERAYAQEPGNFEVNNNLGSAYRMKGDWESAVTYYQHALAAQPGNATVLENLARAYASAGRYEDARVLYEDVLKASPQNWGAWYDAAKVCISLGDTERARSYLRGIQSGSPSFRQEEVSLLLASLR